VKLGRRISSSSAPEPAALCQLLCARARLKFKFFQVHRCRLTWGCNIERQIQMGETAALFI